ncbi:PREDICTED: serpin B12 [Myotis davidii]|uniref:serpin B12 n=1 Tax=Myotis davidii TaxID=225400 RepID=UPI0003EC1450|nr:PREDICTED: serpin B12 [Myotis davidii]
MDSLIAANSKFSFDLFQEISKNDGAKNIFFCPLSLSAALGMVRLGARNDSAQQIDRVLHFDELSQEKTKALDPCLKYKEQKVLADSPLEGQKGVTKPSTPQVESSKDENELLSCYFGQLLSKLDRIKSDYTLSIANRLYGEQEFPICQEYLDGVIQFYHTTIESVDFRKDTEKSRQKINFWVESQSQAKHRNEKKTVRMMNQKGTFKMGFIEEVNAQILEMPYTKGKLSMFVLLPSCSEDNLKGLQELERNITYEKIVAWTSSENMSEKRVAVSFPQFTLEDSYELNSILQDMGITDVFDEKKADLTGISLHPSLYLSKVVHKTFVEVDENGTQAVGASGAVGSVMSAPSWETFNADHPFLFFIRHNKNQTIFFYGRFCSP